MLERLLAKIMLTLILIFVGVIEYWETIEIHYDPVFIIIPLVVILAAVFAVWAGEKSSTMK